MFPIIYKKKKKKEMKKRNVGLSEAFLVPIKIIKKNGTPEIISVTVLK